VDPQVPLVVWLDDLERFVASNPRGITAAHLQSLAAHRRGPTLVACTRGGRGRTWLQGAAADAVEEFLRILDLASDPELELDVMLDDDELRQAEAAFAPDVIEQIRMYGLGPTLSARPLLRERRLYGTGPRRAPEGDARDGQALVDALLALRAVSGASTVNEHLARAAWERVRPFRGLHNQATDATWERATGWAAEEVVAGRALVRWNAAASGWQVDDATETMTREERTRFAQVHLEGIVP
jgi:hypothetical protein